MIALPLLRDIKPRAAKADARPSLEVVPRRRRWPALLAGLASLLVFLGLLGAAVFHTQLAERQLTIDQLERQVQEERARFDELRRDRAVLRSPQRIADEATALGMVPGETSRFIQVDPMLLAIQLAAAGATDDDIAGLLERTVAAKWAGHGINEVHFIRPRRSMSQIGG